MHLQGTLPPILRSERKQFPGQNPTGNRGKALAEHAQRTAGFFPSLNISTLQCPFKKLRVAMFNKLNNWAFHEY